MTIHGRKMIAPIAVAAILLLYYVAFIAGCFLIPGIALWLRLLLGIGPAILGGVVLYVLIQRIKEIRSGEEDDLSQY